MMKRYPFPYLAFGLVFVLLTTACSLSLAQDITPPPGYKPPVQQAAPQRPASNAFPAAAPNPAAGEATFAEKCAPCHGDTGLGDGPQASDLPTSPAPLGDFTFSRQASPSAWFDAVTNGNIDSFMPPFSGSLTEAQRWDLVAFAISLSFTDEMLQSGQEIYQAECAACHGESGAGDGPDAGDTQPFDFTDQEAMALLSGQDLFDKIQTHIDPATGVYEGISLDQDQIWTLVAFLRSLTFSQVEPESGLEAFAPETPTVEGGTPSEVTGTETTSVADENLVTVHGEVTNASGGDVPTDLSVTLHAIDDFQSTFELTATVGSDGVYEFKDVETADQRVFAVTIEYQGITYGSDIAIAEPGTTDYDLPVTIYDTTTDTSSLRFERLHIFFEFPSPEVVRVIELYLASNSSLLAVVPPEDGKPVLTYTVPEEAVNLVFEDQSADRFVLTADGFGDTQPVRPGIGDYQLLFAYDLPYTRSVSLSQPVSFPVDNVVVFHPDQNLKLDSDMLVQSGNRDLNDSPYLVYTSQAPVAAGGQITLKLSGRNPAGASGIGFDVNSNLFVGLGAFLIAVGLGVFWVRRRRAMPEELALAEEPDTTPESIMDAIIAFDDRYNAGDLPEDEYRLRRAELKSRLRDLLE